MVFFCCYINGDWPTSRKACQWWCPVDKTVLANEQVRTASAGAAAAVVEKKALKHGSLKLRRMPTAAYDLDDLDCRDAVKSISATGSGAPTAPKLALK